MTLDGSMPRYAVFALLTMIGTHGLATFAAAAAPVGSPVVEGERDSIQLRGNPLWAVPLSSLTATGDRPIFAPSRQRPAPPPPPPVAAVPPPPTPVAAAPEQIPLRLLGTITSAKNGIAICLNQATTEVVRLRTGENFEGWVLRDVHAREAVFEKTSLRTVLALPSPDEAQAQPPPPPPAAPAQALPANAGAQQPPTGAQQSGTWMDGDGNLIAPPRTR
jgi:hypothetical protein